MGWFCLEQAEKEQLTMKLCGKQPPHLGKATMTDETTNTEQIRVAADCPNERIVMWRCNGTIDGRWCDYRMTDTEMQAHRFDLGCPRCKQSFADFSPYYEDK